MTKRKISYEQDLALVYGRGIACANQRRRVADRQAADKAAAERAAQDAAREAAELQSRYGWHLGARVTGLERTFRTPRTGVVTDGPPSERGAGGVFVTDDDGNVWELGRHSVKAAT